MTDQTFRFVVCVDVPGNTVDEAYRNLRARMASGSGPPESGAVHDGNDWETSDEAYYPEAPRPMAEKELQAAIERVLELELEDV